jgi:hypothetical protein
MTQEKYKICEPCLTVQNSEAMPTPKSGAVVNAEVVNVEEAQSVTLQRPLAISVPQLWPHGNPGAIFEDHRAHTSSQAQHT